MQSTPEVSAARRAYLKADARYGKASDRYRRMPCAMTAARREDARADLRALYAAYLDACATAGTEAR